ncbi:unnamed protein product [Urochloa decumbens]|uniref:Pectinesterase inhibitor domain-containing protein n=1 Tax=Urochloa decumbens TaxID=240449 RepID=A0ABC9FP09_9POAL
MSNPENCRAAEPKHFTMASLQALFCAATLLLVVAHAWTAMAASTTLENACESYAAGDRGSYDYCVWKLRRENNGSAAADARGLAAIAARAGRATAKAARERIAALRANETETASRRDALAACDAEYAAAARRLGHAARAAARREGGDLRRAQALLEEATGANARCDAAFAVAGAGQQSPLDGSVRGLDDEVGLAIALLPSSPPTKA